MIAELRFAVDWPNWLVWMVVAGLTLFTLWIYQRETRTVASPYSWLLPALRATAIALALLLLAAPTWHRRQVVGTPARVVFALDQSLSMNEQDTAAIGSVVQPKSRLTRAVDLLVGVSEPSSQSQPRGWIEELAETHLIDLIGFDAETRAIWSSSDPEAQSNDPQPSRSQSTTDAPLDSETVARLDQADGQLTDLASPIRSIRGTSKALEGNEEAQAEQGVQSLVLISDGRDSADREDAAEAAAELARLGWQVSVVAMGSPDEPMDVGILEVDAPERVADDGRLAGRINLKHFGARGRSATVQLRSGDEVVWSDSIEITTDGSTAVPFDFPVETVMKQAVASQRHGVDRDTVALSLRANVQLKDASDSSEQTGLAIPMTDTKPQNDQLDFRVAAASRDRRLLILDGSSRWELRYIRNLFNRDPAWQVDTVLFGPGTDTRRVRRGEKAGELPDSRRAWARYDAVIFGEVPPDQWTEQDSLFLQTFVRHGGGLIVIDGRYNRIAELVTEREPIAELVPVRYQFPWSRRSVNYLQPTSAGKQHPVLTLSPQTERLGELWKQLPAPATAPEVTATADAEVWGEARTADNESIPWLITRLYGAGRVFYLSTDETWRWRYKIEGRLHGRYWNQLLTAAMQPPYAANDQFLAIGTDKLQYSPGQQPIIRARLLEQSRTGSDAADSLAATTVDAVFYRDGQVVGTVAMQPDNEAQRTYLAKAPALPSGAYQIRIRASGYDSAALKASVPIWVASPPSNELDRVSVDESNLQAIAKAGGGVYVHESAASDLLSQLKPLSRGRIIETDTLLWQTWWVFLIIIALLSIEWWLRKKAGLI